MNDAERNVNPIIAAEPKQSAFQIAVSVANGAESKVRTFYSILGRF